MEGISLYGYSKFKGVAYEQLAKWLAKNNLPFEEQIIKKPSKKDIVCLERILTVSYEGKAKLLRKFEEYKSQETKPYGFLYTAEYHTENKAKTIYENTLVLAQSEITPSPAFYELQMKKIAKDYFRRRR